MAKYTQQQIAEIIIQSLEEAKETAKKNEKASKEISLVNDELISKLKNTVLSVDNSLAKETIELYKKVSENAQKELKKGREALNYIFYSLGFCFLGLICLFFAFYIGFQTKSNIQEDYYMELKTQNKIKSSQEKEFIENFVRWSKQNPKESQNIINKIKGY